MNNRHRRVEKLKKQELNAEKAKFEREYGVSALDLANVIAKSVDAIRKGVGDAFISLGKSIQGK